MPNGPSNLKQRIANKLSYHVQTIAKDLAKYEADIVRVEGPMIEPMNERQSAFVIHVKTREEGLRSFEIRVRELQ